MSKLHNWTNHNELLLNPAKTKIVLFRPLGKKLDSPLDLYVDKIKIECVPNTKFLGINLNEHLDWNNHIKDLCQKLSHTVGIVNRNRYYFPFTIKKILYYALFYSRINYGYLVYGNSPKTGLEEITTLQKKFLRAMYCVDWDTSTKNLFIQSGIIQVHNLYKYKILNIFYNKRKHDLKSYLTNLSKLTERQYYRNTREAYHETFKVPTIKQKYMEQSLKYTLPIILNSNKVNSLQNLKQHVITGTKIN